MANDKYIDKFKKGNDEYQIHAEYAESARTAQTAESVDKIGNVRKYSGFYDGKQREGLQIINTVGEGSEALIELNEKGNFALESKTKHLNLESAKGVQIKPTTTITLDSTRRIIGGKGNEIQVEARFDDFGDVTGYNGADEEWAELKINSRNLDLRCRDHGGIALQIAGKDSKGNENKIKFESDRTNSIFETGTYNGEGGKGLEFGTFNNLHSSLYTGDYRFRGNGLVYGVQRDTIIDDGDKVDYETQTGDTLVRDFKDPINEATPRATWNQIIAAANKCNGKSELASVEDVGAMIAEASIPGYTGTTENLATKEYVQNYVTEHAGGSYQAGTGIHIEDNIISVNNYSQILPLTALTKNVDALKSVEYSKKGNLRIENKGDFAFEAKIDTTDENGDSVDKGDKVVSQHLEFYEAENAYFYKAKVDTTYFDGTPALASSIVLMKDVEDNHNELNYYDNPDYYYKAKYDTVDYRGNEVLEKGMIYKSEMVGRDEEEFYQDTHKYGYKCLVDGALDENGNATAKKTVIDISDITNERFYKNNPREWEKIMTWERVDIWEKNPIWERNASNLNLESDSKIKLLSDKTEVYFEDSEDTDEPVKNKNIMLGTEELSASVNKVVFERSVSKNGVETGCDIDPIISLVYKNNVKDPTKVADFAAFKAGWLTKHTLPKTDEELMEIYDRLLNEPDIPNVTVKLSVLLGLVDRVAELELRVAALENQ